MKRTLKFMTMIVMVLSFVTSCSKDEKDPSMYTFTNTYMTLDQAYLFEYNSSGDKINTQTIDEVVKDRKYTFTATDDAVKVKVYIKYTNYFSSYPSQSKWIQQVFMLKPGSTIDIKLEGSTIIGNKEP